MKKRLDSYDVRRAKEKKRRETKQRELDKLIAHIDTVLAAAVLDESGYHTGECSDLNDARHSVMVVRCGNSRKRDHR